MSYISLIANCSVRQLVTIECCLASHQVSSLQSLFDVNFRSACVAGDVKELRAGLCGHGALEAVACVALHQVILLSPSADPGLVCSSQTVTVPAWRSPETPAD